MGMDVSKLEGAELDAMVAKANGEPPAFVMIGCFVEEHGVRRPLGDGTSALRYSTDWAVGGPIIEREQITIIAFDDGSGRGLLWTATLDTFLRYIDEYLPLGDSDPVDRPCSGTGPTPLIAAMRAYVASKQPR